MHELTDEERASIKQRASADFQGEALAIPIGDPIGELIVVAPFDRKAYSEYDDAEDKDPQTAYSKALYDRLLFPDFATLAAISARWPALPEIVAREMRREAGAVYPEHIAEPLDIKKLPDGLSKDAASKLVSEANGANLWTVGVPGFACVMRAPEPNAWIAARAMYDDAVRKGSGKIDVIDPYVRAAVVWCAEPIADALARKPARVWPLWYGFKRIGGEGAQARTFRL